MTKVRMGVIGIGNMGSEHCRLMLSGRTPEVTLSGVADLRADRRAWARETLPGDVQVFEDGEALIRSECCDAVLIAVPHYAHPTLSISALEHGLHVLCEKPVAVYARQVHPVIEAAERSGRTFALMFNQRTNGVYRRLKALLDSGEMGPVRRVSWTITDWYRSQRYYDSGNWRATWRGEGGGVLLNQCPHQLDLLQWLFGMPTLVRAFCHEGSRHDIEVEDEVTAYLEFPGGATGVFIASTGELPGSNRLEVACDRGKIVCEQNRLTLWRLPHSEETYYRVGEEAYPQPAIQPEELPGDGQNPQHVGVINAFAAHILRGEPLVADGAEGIRSLLISNAMHLSSWLGKPVALPMDEALFARLLEERAATSRLKEGCAEVTYATDHSATGRALNTNTAGKQGTEEKA